MDLVENGGHKGDESGTRKGATGKTGNALVTHMKI